MPRCLSEGVDIFLKSVERQGESGHHFITFRRKFTPGDLTSRKDVPFTAGVRGGMAVLRYEPCSQLFAILQQIQWLCDNGVGVAFFQLRTVTEAPEDTYGEGACRLAGLHICGSVSHVEHFVCGEAKLV